MSYGRLPNAYNLRILNKCQKTFLVHAQSTSSKNLPQSLDQKTSQQKSELSLLYNTILYAKGISMHQNPHYKLNGVTANLELYLKENA